MHAAGTAQQQKRVLLQALPPPPKCSSTLFGSAAVYYPLARAAAACFPPYLAAAACVFGRRSFCCNRRYSSSRDSGALLDGSSRSSTRGTSPGRACACSSSICTTESSSRSSSSSSRGGGEGPPAAVSTTGGRGIPAACACSPHSCCSSSSLWCDGRAAAVAWLRRRRHHHHSGTYPASAAATAATLLPAAAEAADVAAEKTAAGERRAAAAAAGRRAAALHRVPALGVLPSTFLWGLQQRYSFGSECLRPGCIATAAAAQPAGAEPAKAAAGDAGATQEAAAGVPIAAAAALEDARAAATAAAAQNAISSSEICAAHWTPASQKGSQNEGGAAGSRGWTGKSSLSGGHCGVHTPQAKAAARRVLPEQQQQKHAGTCSAGTQVETPTAAAAQPVEMVAAGGVAADAAAETAAAAASEGGPTCGAVATDAAAAEDKRSEGSSSSSGEAEQQTAVGRPVEVDRGEAATEKSQDFSEAAVTAAEAATDDFAKNPDEMVAALDKYIVRQEEAKRCLAIALRDRWRRQQVKDEQLRKEICPNNLLLIGPSGCGKTELAKRLAAFAGAPFIKVAATRFTEVGFVGDDTSSVVRYLAQEALEQEKEKAKREVLDEATKKAMQKVAEALRADGVLHDAVDVVVAMIKEGKLDDVEVNIDEALLCRGGEAMQDPLSSLLASLQKAASPPRRGSSRSSSHPMLLPPASGDCGAAAAGRHGRGGSSSCMRFPAASPAAAQGVAFSLPLPPFFGGNPTATAAANQGMQQQQKKLSVKKAVAAITDHFASEMTDTEEVRERAREAAETKGIIFLDEFDKLVEDRAAESVSSSAFRSKKLGVQRELLTLMEGASVETCVGWVHTEHILFMASGSFLACKPSDIIPELQGRLPVRCDLKPLTEEDFFQILTETEYNLLVQQEALLATEGVKLIFKEDGIREVARIAFHLNTMNANVGARRLKTVLAKVLEETKFAAHRLKGKEVVITKALVTERLQPLMRHADLCKYIL